MRNWISLELSWGKQCFY